MVAYIQSPNTKMAWVSLSTSCPFNTNVNNNAKTIIPAKGDREMMIDSGFVAFFVFSSFGYFLNIKPITKYKIIKTKIKKKLNTFIPGTI